METTRRDVLKITAAAAGVTAAMAAGIEVGSAESAAPATQPVPTERRGDMLYRKLGRTGETVSIVGLGGHHIGNPPEEQAIRIMHAAIDRGINFFDNSW